MSDNILEIVDVTKEFPGITALKGVSFEIKKNTVHCIVGENGAGKSTLIKILAGVQKCTKGKLMLDGKEYAPHSTRQALECGVSVLFQELNVVEQLTVEQNMTLGVEKNRFGIMSKNEDVKKLADILHSIDPSISMNSKVSGLSVGKRQIIQIAKAMAAQSKVLIMDEPTAALSEDETRRLFGVIELLRKNGITIIYISHKLEEIFSIGENVTVMLDGRMVTTQPLSELDPNGLVKLMLGKMVSEKYVASNADRTSIALKAQNISNGLLKNISFDVCAGEIFGFYGLLGAGKTELARALAGLDCYSGAFELCGKKIACKTPLHAYESGICMVPEERRTQGIVANLPIRENITLTNPKKTFNGIVRSMQKEKQITQEYIQMLSIACRDGEQEVQFLSGGNQQKVVFAKCLNSDFKLMILDEPTRGVDVGAKEEIHGIVQKLASEGKSIIVFSSELPEVLNLCDRIGVLYEGELKAIIENDVAMDAQTIMNHALGVAANEA